MKRISMVLAGLVLSAIGAAACAGDKVAGEAVYKRVNCASCHGADAKTGVDPSYPKLAGQHEDYLVHALRSYQRGQGGASPSANIRKNPIMGAFAVQLSAKDVEDVAAYLHSLPGDLSVKH
jgi:cytochrome c553